MNSELEREVTGFSKGLEGKQLGITWGLERGNWVNYLMGKDRVSKELEGTYKNFLIFVNLVQSCNKQP